MITLVLGAIPTYGYYDGGGPLPGGFNATYAGKCSYQFCSAPIDNIPACVNASLFFNGEGFISCEKGEGKMGTSITFVDGQPNIGIGIVGDQNCTSVSPTECSYPTVLPLSNALRKAIVNGKMNCDDPTVLSNICSNMVWGVKKRWP